MTGRGPGPRRGNGSRSSAWSTRRGVRPRAKDIKDETNPKTVADYGRLLAASPRKCGARQQPRIADGYNPFGSQRLLPQRLPRLDPHPQGGQVQVLHGLQRGVVLVPRRQGTGPLAGPAHGRARGPRGEERGRRVDRRAALRRVLPRGGDARADGLPRLARRQRRAGRSAASRRTASPPRTRPPSPATRPERRRSPTFEPVITDSIWPVDRGEGQYTRAKFPAGKHARGNASSPGTSATARTATGAAVEHVYLVAEKTYPVTLTCGGPAGKQAGTWPLEVFEIEHVTDQFKEGRPKDYARVVAGYDRSKLDAAALKELAFLLAEAEELPRRSRPARSYARRFPDGRPAGRRPRRAAAGRLPDPLRPGPSNQAVANYQSAVVKELPATEKLQVLTRLIRLLGVERGEADRAAGSVEQVEARRQGEPTRRRRAEGIPAGGHRRRRRPAVGERQPLRQRPPTPGPRSLRGQPIPPQVRAARLGSYPNSLREYIAGGQLRGRPRPGQRVGGHVPDRQAERPVVLLARQAARPARPAGGGGPVPGPVGGRRRPGPRSRPRPAGCWPSHFNRRARRTRQSGNWRNS